jgi:hypothetical protein
MFGRGVKGVNSYSGFAVGFEGAKERLLSWLETIAVLCVGGRQLLDVRVRSAKRLGAEPHNAFLLRSHHPSHFIDGDGGTSSHSSCDLREQMGNKGEGERGTVESLSRSAGKEGAAWQFRRPQRHTVSTLRAHTRV